LHVYQSGAKRKEDKEAYETNLTGPITAKLADGPESMHTNTGTGDGTCDIHAIGHERIGRASKTIDDFETGLRAHLRTE